MLTTIKGYYEAGEIVLMEQPPQTEKTEVIVTFLSGGDAQPASHRRERKLGGLEGKVSLPDDFNEPLDELSEYM